MNDTPVAKITVDNKKLGIAQSKLAVSRAIKSKLLFSYILVPELVNKFNNFNLPIIRFISSIFLRCWNNLNTKQGSYWLYNVI